MANILTRDAGKIPYSRPPADPTRSVTTSADEVAPDHDQDDENCHRLPVTELQKTVGPGIFPYVILA